MKITRLTVPASPLIDDATLAEWLRIDPTTDAATTAMLLGSAVDVIEGLTGQVLLSASYRVDFAVGYGPVDLSTGLFPIGEITAVNATSVDGTITAITDYSVNLTAPDPLVSVTLPYDAVSVSINLTAGYDDPASVPTALRHAAAVMVAAGYDSRAMIDPKTMATVTNLCARYRRNFL